MQELVIAKTVQGSRYGVINQPAGISELRCNIMDGNCMDGKYEPPFFFPRSIQVQLMLSIMNIMYVLCSYVVMYILVLLVVPGNNWSMIFPFLRKYQDIIGPDCRQ